MVAGNPAPLNFTVNLMTSSLPRRLAWVLAIFVLVYASAGFFLLPRILKVQAEQRLGTLLGRSVTIGAVRVNPFALSVTMEAFDVRDLDRSDLLGWDRLYVNFEARSLITREWTFKDVELDAPHGRLVINRDGSLNVSDLLGGKASAPPATGESAPPPAVRIEHLAVSSARLEFSDLAENRAFTTTLGPVSFTLNRFRTRADEDAPYRFTATSESGETFGWSGTLSASPFRSAGEFTLDDIVVAKYAPYYGSRIRGSITDGKLSLGGRYDVNLGGQRRVKLAGGSVRLSGFKLSDPAEAEPVLDLPLVELSGIDIDFLAPRYRVGKVELAGGEVRASREADGGLNLANLLTPAASPKADGNGSVDTEAVAASGAETGLALVVDEVAVHDLDVAWRDLTTPRPVKLALNNVGVSAHDVAWRPGVRFPVELGFGWQQDGRVQLNGTIAPEPLSAELNLNVEGFELRPLSAYLEQGLNARITQGAVSAKVAVQAELPAGQTPRVTATGDVALTDFGLVDGVRNEDLAGIGALKLKGLRVVSAPVASVELAEAELAKPYARVVVRGDGSLNLAGLARGDTAKPAADEKTVELPAKAAPAGETGPDIRVRRVTVSDGEFSFQDQSLQPAVRTGLHDFGGTITGLSSARGAGGDVTLAATVDGGGPVKIEGTLDPFGAEKHVDLAVKVKDMDLHAFSPYAGKYAGYELARGQLALDIDFALQDRKLDAKNVVTLQQLTFGEPSGSPDATKLPVRLAVALLKDIKGNIVIDLPVQGRTDDPQFRIGRVVGRVLVNLLTKAAVSPFSLLGSMFGGGGEELSWQDFAAGASELDKADTAKLDTVAKALKNRPTLQLNLQGRYDAAKDVAALKAARLDDEIRRAIWERLRADNPDLPPPDRIEIDQRLRDDEINRRYAQAFPEIAAPAETVAVQPPPEAKAAEKPVAKPKAEPEAPKEEKRGFFGRVFDVVTLKSWRDHDDKKDDAGVDHRERPWNRVDTGDDQPADEKTAKEDAARAALNQEIGAEPVVPAGPSIEEKRQRLAEKVEIGDDDLRALAQARANGVRDYLLSRGVAPERVFVTEKAGGGEGSTRVKLTLE